MVAITVFCYGVIHGTICNYSITKDLKSQISDGFWFPFKMLTRICWGAIGRGGKKRWKHRAGCSCLFSVGFKGLDSYMIET